jgi:hypothetical protein
LVSSSRSIIFGPNPAPLLTHLVDLLEVVVLAAGLFGAQRDFCRCAERSDFLGLFEGS